MTRRATWRRVLLATAAVVLVGATPALANPARTGVFSEPFEEGGGDQPRCERLEDGSLECKPTAVSSVPLIDGRVLFWNGIEASENSTAFVVDSGEQTTNGESRVLDLTGTVAEWLTPKFEWGGAQNPQIDEGGDGSEDPEGVLGVPGRPGDGFVGDLVGDEKNEPSSPPDDPQDNDGDMFCGYQIQLADGRILVFGGTDWYSEPRAGALGGPVELEGLRNARVFNPKTNAWEQVEQMKYGRWYPSGVTMPDGKVVAFSGVTKLVKSTQLSQVTRTETFDPATGSWADNGSTSKASLPLLPRLRLMPNGKVFFAGNGQTWGPFGQAIDEATWLEQKFYDPKTGRWEGAGLHRLGVRSGAIDVMLPLKPPYKKATVMMAGGVLGPSPGTYATAVPFTEEYTVDVHGKVLHRGTGNLNHPRWHSSSVVLPDGKVFAVSGGDKDEVISPGTERAVREAEMYDPRTGKWSEIASLHRDRTYHNTAVLLPDGRVLVGGHHPIPNNYAHHRDVPGMANNEVDSSFEIYSPPYLFRGERPTIDGVQSGIAWGSTFDVATAQAGEIDSVVLSSMPAQTHVLDNNQRTLQLAFEVEGGTLKAKAPPDGVAAPPGPYYLFVNRKTPNGPVPSVARIVTIGSESNQEPAAAPLDDSTRAIAGIGAAPDEDSTTKAPEAPKFLPGS